MRINRYIAGNTHYSRRKADQLIKTGQVYINDKPADLGSDVNPEKDIIRINNRVVQKISHLTTTIGFNKPVGYVVSRVGQGNKTIYDILPQEYKNLKPIGRLDKNSSGLIILTNDGDLIQRLSHPSKKKKKVYLVKIDKNLTSNDLQTINDKGVMLDDGISRFDIKPFNKSDFRTWRITMTEGRNRQIRRTFNAIGYNIVELHRLEFGEFLLGNLSPGETRVLSPKNR